MRGRVLVVDDDVAAQTVAKPLDLIQHVTVVRNDDVTPDQCREYDGVLLSPGPGTPEDAGACIQIVRECAGDVPIFGVCLGHQAIAEAIGSTRVTITRLLGDLRNSGLVEIDRKKITVLDPIALAKRFS